jgi:copper-transporting ATPase 1
MKKIVGIEGMSCSHCAKKVEDALYGLPEIEDVKVNLDNKNAEIEFSSEVDDKIISDLIKSVGFTPTTVENV